MEKTLNECYFTPKKDSTSATICANCGKEKMLHTIGEGIKASSVIINSGTTPVKTLNERFLETIGSNKFMTLDSMKIDSITLANECEAIADDFCENLMNWVELNLYELENREERVFSAKELITIYKESLK